MTIESVNGFLDGDRVVMLRRDGARVVERRVPAEHVSYLHGSEVTAEVARQLRASQFVASLAREGEWWRVGWRGDEARRFMCQDKQSPLVGWSIKTYEGDVDPVTRHMVDASVEVQRPRRAYLDLETDSRVPFSRKEEARILSWAVVDDEGFAAVDALEEDSDHAERALNYGMWEALSGYDQVVAWNGDGFDFPVMAARVDALGVRVDMRRFLLLDHMVLFKRMNMHSAESGEEKTSMALQAIAMAVLGEGKNDFDASKTWEEWAAGGERRERLARYNLQDTDLLRKLEAKTGYLDLAATLFQACRVFCDSRGLHPTRQMDGFLLRLGKERGHHFPTRVFSRSSTPEQFKGAYVMEPKFQGIARGVHVCDFASLYPSIILSWNMSPDTVVAGPVNGPVPAGMCRSPLTGTCFSTEKVGILPAALGELLRLRKEWNDKKASLPPGTSEWVDADRRSTAYKVAANSFYGVIGSSFGRYYDRAVAESVTQCGVWLLRETIGAVMERKWKAGYADTDSVYVSGPTKDEFGAFVDACNEELYPRKLREVGCVTNRIKLAYEKEFERIVFVSAKRYAGSFKHYKGKAATADSKPEVKGLEFKRGDAALLARRLQEEVILALMGGCEDVERFHLMVGRSRDYVLGEALPVEQVRLSKSLSKPLKEYVVKKKDDGTAAGQPPHVAVAKQMLERGLEVREGTRIEYVVTDGSSSPMKVAPAIDYTGTEADRYYLWESLVFPPTQRFLEAAFPTVKWDDWANVRPKKVRASAARAAAAGQGGLFAAMEAPEEIGPFVVRLPTGEGHGARWEAAKAAFARHPGRRAVRVVVALEGGAEAELAVPTRVSGSAALREELRGLGAA